MARKKIKDKGVRPTCALPNPCTYAKRQWARLAKMYIQTTMTGLETGTSYCLNHKKKLTVAKYCFGDSCQIRIEKCRHPLKTIGTIHTHPYKDPDRMMKKLDRSGELYHSAGDIRSSLLKGAVFSCVIANNGIGDCLVYKTISTRHLKQLIKKLAVPDEAIKEQLAFDEGLIKGRCKLDLRGKKGGEWLRCAK